MTYFRVSLVTVEKLLVTYMIVITVIVKIYYNISSLPKMYIAVIGKKKISSRKNRSSVGSFT